MRETKQVKSMRMNGVSEERIESFVEYKKLESKKIKLGLKRNPTQKEQDQLDTIKNRMNEIYPKN